MIDYFFIFKRNDYQLQPYRGDYFGNLEVFQGITSDRQLIEVQIKVIEEYFPGEFGMGILRALTPTVSVFEEFFPESK